MENPFYYQDNEPRAKRIIKKKLEFYHLKNTNKDDQFFGKVERIYGIKYLGKAICFLTTVIEKNTIRVYALATRPKFRGHGIATMLMEFLIKKAKRTKKKIWLHASEMGKNIYKKLGFVYQGDPLEGYMVYNP